MAVYHITLHAYRSWRADHPRGYIRKNHGIMKPDPKLARAWDERAKHPAVIFSHEMQAVLLAVAADICKRRGWTFHGGATDFTHGHFLISWHRYLDWQSVRNVLKNILSLMLGRQCAQQGRRWFVDGDSARRVRGRKHFDYLMQTYFPGHRVWWRAGMELPRIPDGVMGEPRASAQGFKRAVKISSKQAIATKHANLKKTAKKSLRAPAKRATL